MKIVSFKNDVLPLKDILYRLALRITLKHEEAEDIVQETLIKIWNRREDLDNVDSLEAYCLTICRNLSLDHLKRKDTHTESLEKAEMKPHDEQHLGPYEQMLQKDRVELIRRLVNHLPEKQRSCMQLRDFEGKSYKEIANILNISEDQVKVNIFRARQVIKQKYQQIEAYGL